MSARQHFFPLLSAYYERSSWGPSFFRDPARQIDVEFLDLPVEDQASSRTLRSRSALPITETDERLIAAAAKIGEISNPRTG